MKTKTMHLAALMAASLFVMPSVGSANPLKVQTEANPSNASAGEKGASIASSALISVVVNDASTGLPVTNLGSSIGNGTAAITLPTGWSLFSNLNAPPGGCLLTPTQFYNWGNGSYNIRVVPFVSNASCAWRSGEYHYVVTINTRSGTSYTGSGLGVLKIK